MQWITVQAIGGKEGHFHLIKLLLNTITFDKTVVFSAVMAQYCTGSISFLFSYNWIS